MSLPHILQTDITSFSTAIPYISATKAYTEIWAKRFRTDKRIKIGIVYKGNPVQTEDSKRSLDVTFFEFVDKFSNLDFYCLQLDKTPAEIRFLKKKNIIDISTVDFENVAAAISNLDLVISVCTSIAHLAGALNKPVWIPLAHVADWRWFNDRHDSPWYPSARLFRQPTSGDWPSVAKLVEEALRSAF